MLVTNTWIADLISSPPKPAALNNFGAHIRDTYRLHFAHELAAGRVKPLIIPYAIIGTFILPTLYFSIPHTRRPWLHRARFPLMLCILIFNLSETVSSSSSNFAFAYAVGLMQAWGILWSATLLLWMNPQFEAERVERRPKPGAQPAPSGTVFGLNGSEWVGRARARVSGSGYAMANGQVIERQCHVLSVPLDGLPDEDVARSLADGYEYYWQAYPADAPFTTRFEWALDLVSSFRGTGWNWGVPILPQFAKAEKPLCETPVDLASIPVATRQGYHRYKTGREWIRAKIVPMVIQYLILDLLSVLMMKDPYFILGPELAAIAPLALPSYLSALPKPVLFVYRGLICFAAILIAIDLIMTIWHLFAHFILGPRVLGTRAELWHYPCIYGGFIACVLDKGMVGYWGGFWHQTFRISFSAPGVWLSRHGYINPASAKGRALAGLLAFAQSGFLHALGSISCLPPSKPWLPPVFFLLCWVGTVVQTTGTGILRAAGVRDKMPMWARRAANFWFTFAWLVYFQYLFSDDLARAGIWMLEPVPVSPLRACGLGRPGDHWFRWDAHYWPRWHVGQHSWESGIAM